jgi:hypothetical protein
MEIELFIQKLKALNLQIGDTLVLPLNTGIKMKKIVDQIFLDWLNAPWYRPEPGYPGHVPMPVPPSSYVSVLDGLHTDHILDIQIIRKK